METNVPESNSFCCNNFATSVKEHNEHEYNIQENTRPSENRRVFWRVFWKKMDVEERMTEE